MGLTTWHSSGSTGTVPPVTPGTMAPLLTLIHSTPRGYTAPNALFFIRISFTLVLIFKPHLLALLFLLPLAPWHPHANAPYCKRLHCFIRPFSFTLVLTFHSFVHFTTDASSHIILKTLVQFTRDLLLFTLHFLHTKYIDSLHTFVYLLNSYTLLTLHTLPFTSHHH